MIGLVDANNFYVSCERVFQPELNGRPVAVLSNNDGCIIARSEELKALEIPMGLPAYQLSSGQNAASIHLRSSNYELYGDMSARLAQLLRDVCPAVAPYSIDEMFIYLDGMTPTQCHALGQQLRRRIRRQLGLPVCVGLAPTHTLAKFANHLAKKEPHFEGVCLLAGNDAATHRWLKATPVGAVWGVGRRLAARLELMGIRTAWALSQADPKQLRKRFSVVLARTAMELAGTPCLSMNALDEPRQRIMTSRSFGQPTGAYVDVHNALRRHAQRSAEKLRRQGSLAGAVLLFLHTNRHRRDQPQYFPQTVVTLPTLSDDTRDILDAVRQGLEAIYRPRYRFIKAGVMLLGLVDAEQHQLSLLNPPLRPRHAKLMGTVDAINRRLGQDTIRFGMTQAHGVWELRCAHRSARFTTQWGELARAGTHPGAVAHYLAQQPSRS